MDVSPEKCTRQPARIAAKNAKSHSNLIQADPSTAAIAGLRDDNQDQEDIRKSLRLANNFNLSNKFQHFLSFSSFSTSSTDIENEKRRC